MVQATYGNSKTFLKPSCSVEATPGFRALDTGGKRNAYTFSNIIKIIITCQNVKDPNLQTHYAAPSFPFYSIQSAQCCGMYSTTQKVCRVREWKKRMEQNIWEKVCDIHTYLENFLYCSENEHPFHCIERRKEKSQLTYQHLYANKLCARNILLLLPSANLLLVRGKHSENPTNLVELKPSLTAYHKQSAGCYHLGWLQTNSFDPGPTAASLLF